MTDTTKCESGCNCFTGGEIRHHKDCVNYPGSLTEMLDNKKEQLITSNNDIAQKDIRIADLRIRLEKAHNNFGAEIEKNDMLQSEINKLKEIIKRKNEIINLLAKDLE